MVPTAVRVARTEVRRTLRTVLSSRTKLLIYGVIGLLSFAPLLLIGSLLLVAAGERLAAGELGSEALATVPTLVSGGVAVGFVGLVFVATARTLTSVADVDHPAFLLVSTPVRTTVVGLMLAEAVLFLIWLAVPTVVLAGALAWGAKAFFVLPAASVTLLVVVGITVPVGFTLGICLRHLLTVYEPIARYRTPILMALGTAYLGGIALGWLDRIVTVLFDLLAGSPLGWPGNILLSGVPAVGFSRFEAAGSLFGGAVVVALAASVSVRVAAFHWFADPVRNDADGETTETSTRWLAAVLSGVLPRPVSTVTVTAIRRTKRAPIRLVYAVYPLFGAIFFVEQIVQTGTLPGYAAVALALYVVWAAGAMFTLNVLGDHGPAMETVLLSTVSGREVSAGTAVAGFLVGLPLALSIPSIAGLVSPLNVAETLLLTAVTVLGVCISPVLATGIGSWFPRFGAVRVTSKRQAVVPSKTAFFVYTVAVVAPVGATSVLYVDAAPGLVAAILSAIFSLLPQVSVTVAERTVVGLAWIVLAVGIAAPAVSFRYAVARFDSYRPY